eukprot:gene21077-41036_t
MPDSGLPFSLLLIRRAQIFPQKSHPVGWRFLVSSNRSGADSGISVELLFFGRAGQGLHAGGAALDHGGHVVSIAGADFLRANLSEPRPMQIFPAASIAQASTTEEIRTLAFSVAQPLLLRN